MITYERLIEVLNYDPLNGAFSWRIGRKGRGTKLGYNAGSLNKKWGNILIGIDGKKYFAHRLAWLYMTGKWPKNQIDHINGNAIDNRWTNLRDVNQSINQQNRHKPQQNNQLGFLGVRKCKACKTKPYYAGLQVEGKFYYLGYYYTPEEAHEAYINAKRELHEGCTI